MATSKKIGLIPAHRLPRNFDTIVDTLWTLSVVMHLLYIAVRIRRLNPASPTFDFQRKTLAINFAKFTCDLGQALPAAAHWSSPPLFDTLCGLTSGLLSTYKIWLESQK